MNQTRASKTFGFTLLEVLVAMSIFAVIGLGANQMLRTMIDTHEATKNVNAEMNALLRFFSMVERDFSQYVPRKVRDEYGEPMESLMVNSGEYPLELTRSGWNNPAKIARSELQREAYSLEDKELRRLYWLVLDRAEDSEPIEQLVLEGVTDFQVNLIDDRDERTDSWPSFDAQSNSPVSLEVLIETESSGQIRRLYALAGLAKSITTPDGSSTNADGSPNTETGNEDPSSGDADNAR